LGENAKWTDIRHFKNMTRTRINVPVIDMRHSHQAWTGSSTSDPSTVAKRKAAAEKRKNEESGGQSPASEPTRTSHPPRVEEVDSEDEKADEEEEELRPEPHRFYELRDLIGPGSLDFEYLKWDPR
jgi:hypothetical protein